MGRRQGVTFGWWIWLAVSVSGRLKLKVIKWRILNSLTNLFQHLMMLSKIGHIPYRPSPPPLPPKPTHTYTQMLLCSWYINPFALWNFRNSKLTHMLQSSVGGDCKTLMSVQISSSTADLGGTLWSLNFSSRVQGVEGIPSHKEADLTELFMYMQMAEKLNSDEKETKKLHDNMQSLQ